MASESLSSRRYTLVRGTGEIASGVAHALHQAGWPVVLHDIATPATTRRRMAFTDAVFDGTARLSGLTAKRADSLADLRPWLQRRRVVPVTVAPLAATLAALPWVALVDARVRLGRRPEPQMRLAPLTIGLGAGFIAGGTVTVAIDTAWDRLGAIVTRGATSVAMGSPHAIAGVGAERFIHAPYAGTFRTRYDVGHWVTAGDIIAVIDDIPMAAPLTGVLRGLVRDGVPVSAGTKVIEVDPRGWDAVYTGVGERAFKMGESVLAVFGAVDWEPLVDLVSISAET